MRPFDTIKELWDHCILCPICKLDRNIDVSAGPEYNFDDSGFWDKNGTFLSISNVPTKFFNFSGENVLDINMLTNQFYSKLEQCMDYFYIQSHCVNCSNSAAYSSDLAVDYYSGKISNIGLDRESAYLLTGNDNYHATILYDENKILVSNVDVINGEKADVTKTIECPMFDLNLSNVQESIDKLKMILMFV
jgi:hypothetical protein